MSLLKIYNCENPLVQLLTNEYSVIYLLCTYSCTLVLLKHLLFFILRLLSATYVAGYSKASQHSHYCVLVPALKY